MKDCANLAHTALLTYAERQQVQSTDLIDLLTDLMHFAFYNPEQFDFDKALRMARIHFDAERSDD